MTSDKRKVFIRNSKGPRIALAVLLTAIAIFHFVTVQRGQGWGDDWAQYVAHARNLADGRPYAETGYIPNPGKPIAPAKYPPGFPLMLAPVYALRGLDLEALKIPVILSFVAALGLFAVMSAQWATDRTALVVTALIGLHPFFWDFKNNILSDLPFLCFLLLALWISEKVVESNARDVARWECVALGAAWWAAYSIRTVGIILPVAVVLLAVIDRKEYRRLIIPLGVFLILAVVQRLIFQGPSEYLTQFSFQPGLMSEGGREYLSDFRTLVDPQIGPYIARVVFWTLTALAVAGAVRFWRSGHRLAIVFSVFYLAMVLVWPFHEGLRMLIPVIPFYLLGVLVGIKQLANRAGKFRVPILAGASILTLALYVREYQVLMRAPVLPGVESPSARALFQFVRDSTPDAGVMIFKKPRALALYTGRSGGVYSQNQIEHAWSYPDQIRATHFLSIRASTSDSLYLRALEEQRPNAVARVFTSDRFEVYELREAENRRR